MPIKKLKLIIVSVSLIVVMYFATLGNWRFGAFYYSAKHAAQPLMYSRESAPPHVNLFITPWGRVREYNNWVSFPFVSSAAWEDEQFLGFGWYYALYLLATSNYVQEIFNAEKKDEQETAAGW